MTRAILLLAATMTGCTTTQQLYLTAIPGPAAVVHLAPVGDVPRCAVQYQTRAELGDGVRQCLKGTK